VFTWDGNARRGMDQLTFHRENHNRQALHFFLGQKVCHIALCNQKKKIKIIQPIPVKSTSEDNHWFS
jgi:hypothetical protein